MLKHKHFLGFESPMGGIVKLQFRQKLFIQHEILRNCNTQNNTKDINYKIQGNQ